VLVPATHVRRPPRDVVRSLQVPDFSTSDEYLKIGVPRVLEQRNRLGRDGLVGELESVIINTEPERQQAAVHEILRFTGLECTAAFEDEEYRTYILKTPGSADFLIRSRKHSDNPASPALLPSFVAPQSLSPAPPRST
jgi:hypothetical protein